MYKHEMLQTLSLTKQMAFDKKRWRVFAEWLKTAREAANFSQEGLADLIDKDRQTIYRLENALSGARRETVIDIAKAVGANIEIALNKAGFALPMDSRFPKELQEINWAAFPESVINEIVEFARFKEQQTLKSKPESALDLLEENPMPSNIKKTAPKNHDAGKS